MSLTEINFYARKMAPFIIILVILGLIVYFGLRLLFVVNDINNPQSVAQQPVQINPTFNKISPPQIPDTGTSGNFTYVLDTLDGTPNVPNATSAASVYFLKKPAASFGFLDTIYIMAKNVGIDTETTKHTLRDRIAEFDDGKQKLTIDIDTLNFSYEYYFGRDEDLFTGDIASLSRQAESMGATFMTRLGKYNQEFSRGKRNLIYLRFDKESNQITTLQALEGANMIEVDYHMPDIGLYPRVTSNYYNSPNYVILATKGFSSIVVKAQTKYFEHATDQVGLYPIRTSEQAWEDLKIGKGHVISAGQPDGEIKIKKVFLAFYDPDIYQEYLQPVYVFLGDNQFVAYVTAVTDEYLLTQQE